MIKKADNIVQIENHKTRVTQWDFKPGTETGWHHHEYDYVVIPMQDGILKLVNGQGSERLSELKRGVSYFREAGVEHNVINANDFDFSFIEIEYKLK